jgi:L-fucose mutarotase/ribose pyranase (RbsD/FucU family)
MKAADTQVPQSWQQIVAERLPLYGHRNWIVIADSAYPAQSRAGIEMVVSGAEQTDVLKQVLSALAASRHIRPIVYTDRELRFVPEQDAPALGIIVSS